MVKEVWKTIPGLPDYEASDQGRLRSYKRDKKAKEIPHLMACVPDEKGYLLANCTINSKGATQRVHRLIARAFIGEIPIGHQINHKNGIKSDNRLCNLEICTPSQNQRHRTNVLGVNLKWYRSPGARKLTAQNIRDIRTKVASGRLFVDVARDYEVSANCISNIWKRKRWAHVA